MVTMIGLQKKIFNGGIIMAMNKAYSASRNYEMEIEHAQLTFTNFTGEDNPNSEYSCNGQRSVCIFVDDIWESLQDDGFNIKWYPKTPEEDKDGNVRMPRPYIKANINYKGNSYDAKVFVGFSENDIFKPLNERTIGELKGQRIRDVFLKLSIWDRVDRGRRVVTPSVNEMYVIVEAQHRAFQGRFRVAIPDEDVLVDGPSDDEIPF